MKDESDQLPHARPAPTEADKNFVRRRDRLLARAGQQLAEAAASARKTAAYMRRRRGR
jgi:hypothetical protein